MSYHKYTDAVNWVYDTIKANVGAGKAITYVKAESVWIGQHFENVKVDDSNLPLIIVRLPDPALDPEEYKLIAGERREGRLVVIVALAMKPQDYDTSPYGRSGDPVKLGILELMADVKNLLDTKGVRDLGGLDYASGFEMTDGGTDADGGVYRWNIIITGQIEVEKAKR